MTERAGAVAGFAPDSDDPPPIILHVDCDCFYAACERLRHPDLEGEPMVIGMGYDQEDPHGAVATASYEAREYGVESAMAISEALELLPRRIDADASDPEAPDPDEAGYYLPVEMEFYQSIDHEVREILEQYADPLEPISIDEAYLDVTETTSWETVESFGRDFKAEIRETVGIPVSIGVAPTKSAAKVASDFDKPDGLVVVEPGDVQEFFAPLNVEEVHGIGPVTANNLREMGIDTAGDLAAADPDELESNFGRRGREVHQRARGHDPREVTPPDDPKSISKETSLGRDTVTDLATKEETVRDLAQKVADRTTEKDALYRTIGIKAVEPPYEVNTRERSLGGPIQNRELLEEIVLDLLTEFEETPIRKLGVRVSNLSFSEQEQASLMKWESDGSTSSMGLSPPDHSQYR